VSRFETANREDGYGNVLIKSSGEGFRLYEGFVDVGVPLGARWTVDAGVNVAWYDGKRRVGSLSPRVRVGFARRGVTAWADYARSVQYLGLYPYFTVKTPVDIWHPLGRGNRPAVCHQFSTGVNVATSSWFTVYAGLFYKDMRRVKDFTREPGTTYAASSERQVEGKGYAKGLEVDLRFHGRRVLARANYTLSESRRVFAEINDGRPFFPPYDVKHHVALHLAWTCSTRLEFSALWSFSSGVNTTFPAGIVIAKNLPDAEERPVLIPVYKERYNYRLPANHRLDVGADYTVTRGKVTVKVNAGAYNVYNHPNPAFVYFRPETGEGGGQRLVARSKVLVPFVPYLSLRLSW
jgi:hypothetical protein